VLLLITLELLDIPLDATNLLSMLSEMVLANLYARVLVAVRHTTRLVLFVCIFFVS